MDLTVSLTKPLDVEIGATGLRQLAQEIKTLLITRKGSVPLDRDFGIDWSLVDKPIPIAKQYMVSEIALQLEKYVPRVKFKQIEFPETTIEKSVDGFMPMNVIVEIREEYLNELS